MNQEEYNASIIDKIIDTMFSNDCIEKIKEYNDKRLEENDE